MMDYKKDETMALHHVVLFDCSGDRSLEVLLSSDYESVFFSDQTQCLSFLDAENPSLLLLDLRHEPDAAFDLCEKLHDDDCSVPVIAFGSSDDLQVKLRAFENGCDDFVHDGISDVELSARLMKSIFNKIANDQLKSRVQQANEMAFSAMVNTSELGTNIKFLLDSYQTNNIDELGQLFFRLVKSYNICCSLQMRSEYGVKNMEENGMAKDLESQLMTQMVDAGRFYDFGQRTLINYNQVSILIKNMPVDDEIRYGVIKDNIFALVQGLDARITTLDAFRKTAQEKLLLEKVSGRVQSMMREVDDSFQVTMREIARVVEDMSDALAEAIPEMGLSESQEVIIERIVDAAIHESQNVFNSGLRLDEKLLSFIDTMEVLNHQQNTEFSAQRLERLIGQLGQG
jgi:FixJ family two-component response regulator